MTEVLAGTLLMVGVTCQLLACLGVFVMRDVFDRLHFLSAAGAVGPTLIMAAVLVRHGFSALGIKALLVTGVIGITGPVMTHAIARMARIRREGGLHVGRGATG
jgi:monovalent cation/proton antiporter MnhG/PhaG subunit